MGSEESAEVNNANGEANGDLKREYFDKEGENLAEAEHELQETGSAKGDGDLRQRKGKKNTKNEKKDLRKDNLQKNNKPPKLVKPPPKTKSSLLQFMTRIPKWLSNLAFFLVMCVLAAVTRLWQLDRPPHICWDETHFGKHANFYIKGEFFFDVHPPLAKMLIAMAGYLSGYDGNFAFDKPGDQYGDHNYVGMRLLCTTMGALCIPLAYLTVWELTKSTAASVITAAFIIFDCGCITISQYILLDPILMFYIMLSCFCLTKFKSHRNNSFSFKWWAWMAATGISLSCAFSCKWVGLFVILWAGLTTVADLWELLGNLNLSLFEIGKHFMARVLCLIMLPILVYLFWFAVHFKMLPNSGPGDGFFSSAFQSTLKGNSLYHSVVPEDLAFGAVVTFKNHRPGGALLHSHPHLYPKEVGPEQQQVTAYSHKDDNNKWLVKKAYEEHDPSKPVEFVKNGDWIRLEHTATKRNLHSHNEKAPLTKHHFQVAAYGENGQGDANDFWMIEVVGGSPDGRIKTVKTSFRLVHVNIACALHAGNNNLPKWGYEQIEVSCNPHRTHENNLWNVEGHENDQVPKASSDFYRPSFFESVYESHVVMAQTNAGFKPKEGEVTSVPWQWPINYRGQMFSGGDHRVYLLGNPVLWWFILGIMGCFLLLAAFHAVRKQRGFTDLPLDSARHNRMVSSAGWLLIGWAFHYFPFYCMGRVLYFHHYFPAYLFTAMAAGIILEYLCGSVSQLVKSEKWKLPVYYGAVSLLVLMAVVSFNMFHGLSYGMAGPLADQPNATAAVHKWMDSWEI